MPRITQAQSFLSLICESFATNFKQIYPLQDVTLQAAFRLARQHLQSHQAPLSTFCLREQDDSMSGQALAWYQPASQYPAILPHQNNCLSLPGKTITK